MEDFTAQIDCINAFIVIVHKEQYNTDKMTDEIKESLHSIINDHQSLLTIMLNLEVIFTKLNNIGFSTFVRIVWYLFNEKFYDDVYVETFSIVNDDFVKHFLCSSIGVELVKIKFTKSVIQSIFGNTEIRQNNMSRYNDLLSMINDSIKIITKLYGYIRNDFIEDQIHEETIELIKSANIDELILS